LAPTPGGVRNLTVEDDGVLSCDELEKKPNVTDATLTPS
jgi:hypothetical protein